MKKITSLFLIMILLLSLLTTVSAVGEKQYLGDISFNIADNFKKIEDISIALGFQHSVNTHQTIRLTMLEDYLTGTGAKNIADIDESILEQLLDDALTEENLSAQMTLRNGFDVSAEITYKQAGMKETNTGIPVYLYEITYTGYASGYNPFYGHYTVAMFGYFNDMYMFEMDKKQGETDINEDFVEMLNTVNFINESSGGMEVTDKIKIKIDGSYITPDSDPVIVNDRTLVPIRAIAEALGCTVEWEAENRTVNIRSEKIKLSLIIDYDRIFKVTFMPEQTIQENYCIDVAPQIINDRTYLPVRAVGEALGCEVSWDGQTRTVVINSK